MYSVNFHRFCWNQYRGVSATVISLCLS